MLPLESSFLDQTFFSLLYGQMNEKLIERDRMVETQWKAVIIFKTKRMFIAASSPDGKRN